MNEPRDTLPPSEVETSPHHEIPKRSHSEELRDIFTSVLNEQLVKHLEPLHGLRDVVDKLRGSLDLAVNEWRVRDETRASQIADLENGQTTHSRELSALRVEVADLRNGRDADHAEIERLRQQVNEQAAELARWAAVGGPPS